MAPTPGAVVALRCLVWPQHEVVLLPDKTVRAPTYGHELGLPVVAWIGPDPKDYSLTRLRAVTASGEVVAELTF